MCTLLSMCMKASQPPYVYVMHQELIMDVLFMQARRYLSKITTSHSSTLNTKIANQNMLKRILIAMQWTHKIKTKAKYISISNILHLLGAPASIPRVGAVLACLVVESKSNCKFSIISDFCLIVDSCFHPSRALKRSIESFTPLTWTYFC